MKSDFNADASAPEPENNHSNYLSTDNQPNWRSVFDFVDNNKFPKIPGVNTAIISDLFGTTSTSRRTDRKISPTTLYLKRRRRVS